ncbi:UNVERIFIED_CONTAM: hypothetical protein FKN15_043872 [Acipenser sinensis]
MLSLRDGGRVTSEGEFQGGSFEIDSSPRICLPDCQQNVSETPQRAENSVGCSPSREATNTAPAEAVPQVPEPAQVVASTSSPVLQERRYPVRQRKATAKLNL